MLKERYNVLMAAFLAIIFTACSSTKNCTVQTSNNIDKKTRNRSRTKVISQADNNVMSNHISFSPDILLEKLKKNKRTFATGWNTNTGIWIICTQQVKIDKGISETEAATIAETRARNKIASFLGSSVSSKEELIYSEENQNGKVVSKEIFNSVKNIDVNQFLRGVTIFKQDINDGELYAAFYVTGELIDSSNELEKQLRKAPPGTVRAVGFGVIVSDRIPPAKRAAMQSAMRNAVEQVMGTTIIGQSQLMDNYKAKSKVISQTVGDIKQYRIVKEKRSGNNYQVIINAKVGKKHLLDNYAAIVRSMGNPGFYIKTVDPDLRTALIGFLTDLGITIVDDKKDAQFIVDANCKYLQVKDEHYGKGIQIDLHLGIQDVQLSRRLFQISNKPRLTSTYSGNFHQIRQSSAKKAFKFIKKKFHKKLDKVIMDWVLNGHNVSVVFNNFSGDRELAKCLEKAIVWVPCAKVQTKKINGNSIEFICNYVGATADFEEFLYERLKKDLPKGVKLPKTKKINISKIELSF